MPPTASLHGGISLTYQRLARACLRGTPLRAWWRACNPASPSARRKFKEERRGGNGGFVAPSLTRCRNIFSFRKNIPLKSLRCPLSRDPSPFADCGSGLFLPKKSCLVRYGLRASALAFVPYRFAFRFEENTLRDAPLHGDKLAPRKTPVPASPAQVEILWGTAGGVARTPSSKDLRGTAYAVLLGIRFAGRTPCLASLGSGRS